MKQAVLANRAAAPRVEEWRHLESSEAMRNWMGLLRHEAARAGGAGLAVALDGLSSVLDRQSNEHQALSAEVLCAYEQLGMVFEVTRNLATVRSEAQVMDLFVQCLGHSFAHARVSVLPGAADFSAPPSADPWLCERVAAAQRSGRVSVETRPAESGNGRAGRPPTGEIMIGPVFAGAEFVSAIIMALHPGAPPFQVGDMRLVESLTMFCGDLIRNHRLVGQLHEMSLVMVRALVNAVDQKDEYTSGHSIRVGYFATALGRRYGLNEADLQMLQWSALLHDIGKIGIRDDVLKKTGRLTDDEFKHIQEHPVRSHKVVQQIPHLLGALDGILYHHEHYDGGGYPQGLRGDAIPLQARLIQIADVFDALTSNRSYRRAHDWRAALDILRQEAGKTVDPNLQNLFDEWVRAELDHDPGSWNKLIEKANRFAQDGDDILRPISLTDPGVASPPKTLPDRNHLQAAHQGPPELKRSPS
jgi:HD-GYP domain-containing protein (c-di-GMP phosphodiesterase class II)